MKVDLGKGQVYYVMGRKDGTVSLAASYFGEGPIIRLYDQIRPLNSPHSPYPNPTQSTKWAGFGPYLRAHSAHNRPQTIQTYQFIVAV